MSIDPIAKSYWFYFLNICNTHSSLFSPTLSQFNHQSSTEYRLPYQYYFLFCFPSLILLAAIKLILLSNAPHPCSKLKLLGPLFLQGFGTREGVRIQLLGLTMFSFTPQNMDFAIQPEVCSHGVVFKVHSILFKFCVYAQGLHLNIGVFQTLLFTYPTSCILSDIN